MTNVPVSPVVELLIPSTTVALESFETGPPYVFATVDAGAVAWAPTSASFHYGLKSLRAGTIANGQTSDFLITSPVGAQQIKLWLRSDIATTDFLRVIIGGVTVYETSGDSYWALFTYPVAPGQVVTIRYSRVTGGGSNAAWIDDVEFTQDKWVDITEDVRLNSADSGGGIRIKRGRPNEAPVAEPTELDITINNRDGKYSELNPSGPYFGKLGRNQPLRVALTRVSDPFSRSLSNSWGSTPDWVDTENVTRSGYAWSLVGTAANFDINGTEATIQAATGLQTASFGVYADVDVRTRVKASNLTSEFGIVLRTNAGSTNYYTAYVTPTTSPDRVQIGRVTPTQTAANWWNLSSDIVANTWYWMHAQITGRRIRIKVWREDTAEPAAWNSTTDMYGIDYGLVVPTGSVGLFAKDGNALVTFSEIEVNVWRAHTEVVQFPVKFDLSRQDRWIPLQARGILRRLGQGRKSLDSAVTHHLAQYAASSAMWYPLERESDISASNSIAGGYPGLVSGVTTEQPDLSGIRALPGVSGVAHLSEDTSYFIGRAKNYPATTAWTVLTFFTLDSNPASDAVLFTYTTTGTARTITAVLQPDSGLRITLLAGDGTVLESKVALMWNFGDFPIGCWMSGTLYLFQSGGTVTWAFNYHRPEPDLGFFTINGSYSGNVGLFRQITSRGSAVHTAAGGLRIAQVLHYPGDLPFVTADFANAASGYREETNTARFVRMTADAGIPATLIGSGTGDPMGAQLPNKQLELLQECAEVGGGSLEEDRDSPELILRTRTAIYNIPKLTLDVDEGHLSYPLEPAPDDQMTRNDVTVARPNGGSRRSVQETGPLNVNPPEDDPDGVGVYDEAPEINYGLDSQLQAAADWRRSRGTVKVPRYPSLTMDLTSVAYAADSALSARALAIDSGSLLDVVNPEVGPDSLPQVVQGYEETIDQYELKITATSTPAQTYDVGVVEYTSRVSPVGIVSAAPFTVGVDTSLKCRRLSLDYDRWVTTATDPLVDNFDIMVGGARLHVTDIAGASDPQTITVDIAPINGVGTGLVIPAGQPISLAAPWRVAW